MKATLRKTALGAGLLAAALGAWAGADAGRRGLWTTTDEPVHVSSARELRSGPGLVSNVEHPVLMKVVAAAALPASKAGSGIDEVRSARRLFPVLFALLVLVTGAWAGWRSGAAAGLTVAALLAIEPSLRGHGALVTSDLLVTLFLVGAAAALDRAAGRRDPAPGWIAASGALFGLAMASKYSAAPFLAAFLPLALLRLRLAARRRPAAVLIRVGVLFLAVAIGTLGVVQAAAFATTSDEAFRAGIATQFRDLPQKSAVESLVSRLPKWAAAYGAGTLFVQGVAGPGARINYFLGEASGVGFPAYFPVALAVKLTTAAFLALAAAPLVLASGLLRSRGRRRCLRLVLARSLLAAGLGAAWLLAAILSNVNIGVRHVFPVVPFFLVAASGVLATRLRTRPRAGVALAAVLLVLSLAEAAAGRSREISFGNLLAGGNAGLPRILSDSNVDWSQEQGKLFDRVRRGDLGRVGLVTIWADEEAARAVGILGQVQGADAPVDTVFVSRHLWDLAPALERSTETWSKFVWARGWLVPLRRGLEERAASVENFGDAYVLMRLRPPAGG